MRGRKTRDLLSSKDISRPSPQIPTVFVYTHTRIGRIIDFFCLQTLLRMVDVKILETLDEDEPSLVRVESAEQGGNARAVRLDRGELRADGSPVLVKWFEEHDGTYRNEIERHKELL